MPNALSRVTGRTRRTSDAALWLQIAAGVVCAIVVLTSSYPLLMATSFGVLYVAGRMLWRTGVPPVLLFAVFFQWAQVSGELLHAVVTGEGLFSPFVAAWHLREALWLGLIGLLVLTVGMWIPYRSLRIREIVRSAWEEVQRIDVDRVFLVYAAAVVYTLGLPVLKGMIPQASQIWAAAAELRWAFLFLLTVSVLRKKRGKGYLFLAILFEVVQGIGYFSKFKTVFFVVAIAGGAAYTRIRTRSLVTGLALVLVIAVMGSVWSAIEADYRRFLNQGTGQQVVLVSKWDQVERFTELATSVSWDELRRGAEATLNRIAYVQFFAATLDYVPKREPHEHGKIWGDAIQHILMPRIFFPNKPVLKSDSEITRKYTGIMVAGGARGTSISIGYMGESYVDFGRYGMFVPVFLLGLAWGGMFVFFVRRARLKVIGFSLATAVLLNANRFEITSTKLLGGVLMKFIVLALILHFVMPYVTPWLFRNER